MARAASMMHALKRCEHTLSPAGGWTGKSGPPSELPGWRPGRFATGSSTACLRMPRPSRSTSCGSSRRRQDC
jgi:hypothetical protein